MTVYNSTENLLQTIVNSGFLFVFYWSFFFHKYRLQMITQKISDTYLNRTSALIIWFLSTLSFESIMNGIHVFFYATL